MVPDMTSHGTGGAHHGTIVGLLVVTGVLTGALLHTLGRSSDHHLSEHAHDADALRRVSLNVSQSVYWDVNENGGFDEGDRPLAGVSVRMWRPDGSEAVRTSNVAGFANFTTSLGVNAADISVPGVYFFEVEAPSGWVVADGERVQEITFAESQHARARIRADRLPAPVGLIPSLYVEGRVPRSLGGPALSPDVNVVSVVGSDDEVIAAELTQNGFFRIEVPRSGSWGIEVAGDAGERARLREFTVPHLPVRLGSALGAWEPKSRERLERIDFGRLAVGAIAKVPENFQGFRWRNVVVVERNWYGGEGYVNVAGGEQYVAYASSGYPVSVRSPRPFDFVGATLGVAWVSGEGETLVIVGRRGERIVVTDTLRLSATTPIWFDGDYRDITELTMTTHGNWQLVFGDFTVRR
jgi:hypothetical protein